MIGTELVREFIATILLTGRIKDESPVSCLLIAEPEHGKTSVVLETPFPNAVDLSDCTGKGLQEVIKFKPEISHVIFNDLTALNSHGRTVRHYLISMINAMTEEGIRSVAFPGQVETFSNGKRGVVACLTPDLIKDGRTWWHKIGLTSRMMPMGYSYSGNLVLKIKSSIDNNEKTKTPDAIRIPAVPVSVKMGAKQTQEVRNISDQKARELGDQTGIRRLKQFRRLVMGHALLTSSWRKAEVSREDIHFLTRILPYISYEETPEL